jgi:hypothetical protein
VANSSFPCSCEKFNSFASEIIEVTKHNSETVFDVIREFSVTTTSFALYANCTWPFVAIPDFEARSSAFCQVTRAQFLAVLPKVSEEAIEAWGNYSVEHQGWIHQSIAYNEVHGGGHDAHAAGAEEDSDGHDVKHAGEEEEHEAHEGEEEQPVGEEEHDELVGDAEVHAEESEVNEAHLGMLSGQEHDDEDASIHGMIYRFENEKPVIEAGPEFVAPLWQAGPVPPNTGLINFNMLSIPLISRVFNSVLESQLPVLSQVLDLTEVFSEAGSQAFVEHLHGEEAGEASHPESLVLQPIFEDFGVNPKITGALLVALPWNVFFDNLLNDEASVVCVVRNICGQTFTYRIKGQYSIFLGRPIIIRRQN